MAVGLRLVGLLQVSLCGQYDHAVSKVWSSLALNLVLEILRYQQTVEHLPKNQKPLF